MLYKQHFDMYFEQILKFWVHGPYFHLNTIRKSYGLMLRHLLIENDFISFRTNECVTFVIATKFCPLLFCAGVSEHFALQQVDFNVSWQKGRKINFNYLKICPLAQSIVLRYRKQAVFCFLSNSCQLKRELIIEVIAHGENPVGAVWFHMCFSSSSYVPLICGL